MPDDQATSPTGDPVAPADRPSLSATRPPTPPRPTAPPRKPTDNRPTDLIAGRITRGGDGPCYGLVDENDREYALHGPDAGPLAVGAFVTLRVAPPAEPFDCGPGTPMRIVTDRPSTR
ncbi:hypothetical protein [Micromonospora mirobrigensis]|uniref:Uncharacterized protein n=1 Tax=Micromonospora mirobrigensis TaxID=262898 RepID=A0A1C4VCX3_9ACTN|nr:hypothetical protein [Micromonospora mirobrigensis]SCE81736.1 hypothetical protein GA0070564_1011118 [Micromonospora mirobrigensis]